MESQIVNQNKLLKVRNAKDSDISEIIKIQSETNLSLWKEEDYKNEIGRNDSIFKVAVSCDKLIGFACVRLLFGKDANIFETAEVLNIAVRKALHNQKVGQKIFDDVLVDIKNLDIKKIWLEVRESNIKAIKFYRKNNFNQTFVRKNYYNKPIEDALTLVRE